MSVLVKLLFFLSALTFCEAIEWASAATSVFKRIDASSDGRINRKEIDNFRESFDTNKDGNISKLEYTAAIAAKIGNDAPAMRTLKDLLGELDLNDDGRLNKKDSDKLFVTPAGEDRVVGQLEFTE